MGRKRGSGIGRRSGGRAWEPWVRRATVAVLTVVAAALIAPFDALIPTVTLPLLIGAMAGCWTREPLPAAVAGGLGAISACATVLGAYDTARFVTWVQTRMPAYVIQDTTADVFEYIVALQRAHPLSLAAVDGQGLALAAVYVLLTAGVAAGLGWWLERSSGGDHARLVAWGVAAVLAICFAYTAWAGSAGFRARIATEPADGNYAYDAAFNVKTFHRMRAGESFYDAYAYSIMHDSRQQAEGLVVDGKFTTGSGMMFRPPAVFHLWRVAGAAGPDGVMLLSIACCAALVIGAYPAFREMASTRAVFVSAVLYPGLMLHTIWYNVWFPDWWAALAILASALLLASHRYWAAGALALAAVLFRESSGPWMLVLAAVAFVCWRRVGREWMPRAISYAVGLAGAAGLFVLHARTAQRYFVTAQSTYSPLQLFTGNMGRSMAEKLMSPTSYLMLPYGMYVVPTLLLMPLASVGFWLALPKGSAERLVLTAYPTLMLVFYLTLGATSSYWGQMVMPVSLAGAALLLARADVTIAWIASGGAGDPRVPA